MRRQAITTIEVSLSLKTECRYCFREIDTQYNVCIPFHLRNEEREKAESVYIKCNNINCLKDFMVEFNIRAQRKVEQERGCIDDYRK